MEETAGSHVRPRCGLFFEIVCLCIQGRWQNQCQLVYQLLQYHHVHPLAHAKKKEIMGLVLDIHKKVGSKN